MDVLTTEEAAKLLRMTPVTLLAMTRKGEIPAVCMGNKWLFVREQLLNSMKERALAEQIRRKEQADSAMNEPTAEKKRGRASKKVDITKYPDFYPAKVEKHEI